MTYSPLLLHLKLASKAHASAWRAWLLAALPFVSISNFMSGTLGAYPDGRRWLYSFAFLEEYVRTISGKKKDRERN